MNQEYSNLPETFCQAFWEITQQAANFGMDADSLQALLICQSTTLFR
jgi:hypothetical protein